MAKQIFVNLPIKDLNKSIAFFTKLGFKFNPQFTDENATCMIIGENMFAMLLMEKFFKTFIKKEIADAKKITEVLVALAVENREKVDELVIRPSKQEAKSQESHRIMAGCMGGLLRILMDIFGKCSIWMKAKCRKR